jgi:hypothetical protein
MPRLPAALAAATWLAAVLAAPALAHATPFEDGRRFGVGLRSTGQVIAADGDDDNPLGLQGGGLQLRYRFGARFSWEVSLETIETQHDDDAGDAVFTRSSHPVTLSVLWHITRPERAWDLYLLFGFGGSDSEVRYLNAQRQLVSETVEETHVHVGIGAERVWRRIGVGAEWRLVGASRKDGVDGAVPASSSGSQLSLTATYYF